MTKKHFEAIAKIFSIYKGDDENGEDLVRRIIARDVAAVFATTNPNFDRARFLKACNVEV